MKRVERIAVLLSGRGSNFLAIARAAAIGTIPAKIVTVISNRPEAAGIVRAREMGLPAVVADHRSYPDREAHEDALMSILELAGAELLVLAGYMRLLSPRFVSKFRDRIVNIHPSLLPSFPGMDAQRQAIEHGVRISGCTVHLVEEGLDCGPIVVQRAVEVSDSDDAESLAARILPLEHEAYVDAIRLLCAGYRVEGRRIVFTPPSASAPRK